MAVLALLHEFRTLRGLILEADVLDDVLSVGIRGKADGGEHLARFFAVPRHVH